MYFRIECFEGVVWPSIRVNLDRFQKEVSRYGLECALNQEDFNLLGLKNHLLRPKSSQESNNPKLQYATGFLEEFISEIERSAKKKPGGRNYSTATLENYQNLLQALSRFQVCNRKRIEWSQIDRKAYNSFIKWHEDLNYSRNYIGMHIKDLKALISILDLHASSLLLAYLRPKGCFF